MEQPNTQPHSLSTGIEIPIAIDALSSSRVAMRRLPRRVIWYMAAMAIAMMAPARAHQMVVSFGTPTMVLSPRVTDFHFVTMTVTTTRKAKVPMPAASPDSRTRGMPTRKAITAVKATAIRMPKGTGTLKSRIQLRKPGMLGKRLGFCAAGMVTSAEV
jgi:hypothetical protein